MRYRFLRNLDREHLTEVYTFIKDLYHWSRQNADDVRFGQNTKIGTFTFYYTVNNQQASIFTIYSDGSLWLNFGYMEKISTKEEIEEFKTQCSKINLIRNLMIEKKDKSYMSIPVVKLIEEAGSGAQLKTAILNFMEKGKEK